MSVAEVVGTKETGLPPDILLEKTDELFESLIAKLAQNKQFADAAAKKYLGLSKPNEHAHKVEFDNYSQTFTLYLFRQEGFDILFLSRALSVGFERIKLVRDNGSQRAGYVMYEKTGPANTHVFYRDSAGAVDAARSFIRNIAT